MNKEKKNIENIFVNRRRRTKKIATYVFLVFLVFILILEGYFSYEKYVKKNQSFDFSQLIDPDFNKLFLMINNPDEENPEYAVLDAPDCIYQGQVFKHGEKVTLYSRELIDPYDSCDRYKAERLCSAGLLAGEERFKYFSCQPLIDCMTTDNGLIKNGESIELYSRYQVDYGDQCSRYRSEVKCVEGQLIGDKGFEFKECRVSFQGTCSIDGEILGSGQTHTFFSKDVVGFDEQCSDFIERRFCDNGHLQGNEEYKYWLCQQEEVKNCYLSGITVAHGGSRFFFSRTTPTSDKSCQWFVLERNCYDGILSGLEEYKYLTCE